MTFINIIYQNYIKALDLINKDLKIDFSNLMLAYDYNEIQELLYKKNEKNFVFLVGPANLRKKEMLEYIYHDLYSKGVEKEEILYLDYELPILHNTDPFILINDFYKQKGDLTLIINEIQLVENWFDFIETLRLSYPNIQLICSSTTAPFIYEKLFTKNISMYKIIVLSDKNDSNIKYIHDGFGVSNEFKYNIKNQFIEIKGLTPAGKKFAHIEIPKEIQGLPVKVISSGAFHDRKEITSISIPDDVEMIGDYAFINCTSLTEIKLPKKLEYIGECAFAGCFNLDIISKECNITHIGNSALYNTKWLNNSKDPFIALGSVLYTYRGTDKDISLPKSIKHIGRYSFMNTSIKSINLHTIYSIEEGAFYNCKQLLNVTGYKWTSIPAFCFFGCKKLKELDCSIDHINKFGFYDCNSIENITLNNSTVAPCGLAHCSNLKHITGTLQTLQIGALAYCYSLKKLPKEIKYVGSFAFYKSNLKNIKLEMCIDMGDFVFGQNVKLQNFSINRNALIGKSILFGCTSVNAMDISGKYKIDAYFGKTHYEVKKMKISGDIIENLSRDNKFLESLELEDVHYFGKWSFYNNTNLAYITLNTVDYIGGWAFSYCSKIKKIHLPSCVKRIELNGFRYCYNLSEIIIKNETLLELGINALYATSENKKIYVNKTLVEQYKQHPIWKEYNSSIMINKSIPI